MNSLVKKGIQSTMILKKSTDFYILRDPGAEGGGEGKSKRAEKYGTKKSKERREEPLGTMLTRQVPNDRRCSEF